MERARLKEYNKIVIKIGTSSLTHPTGRLKFNQIEKLVNVLAKIKKYGKQIVLVSSGAITVGNGKLGRRNMKKPSTLAGKQAAAAVGQAVLMKIYQKYLGVHNQLVGQMLLTKEDLDQTDTETKKYFNAKNTLHSLLNIEDNIIPIINENDTISTSEIEFGDNDTLSAYVAKLMEADLLIILSDIDGLYSADPRKNKDAELIQTVTQVDKKIEKSASGAGSSYGTGGMATKITAAKICAEANIDTVITNGKDPSIIFDILEGKMVGTLFLSNESFKELKKAQEEEK